MKDINEKALALGMNEATKLLNGQLEKGRIDGTKMGQVLSASPRPSAMTTSSTWTSWSKPWSRTRK